MDRKTEETSERKERGRRLENQKKTRRLKDSLLKQGGMPEGNIMRCSDSADEIHTGCTHTFSSSDVNRAGDVGDALVHAHLQVDHPTKHKLMTDLIHLTQKCTHITHLSAPHIHGLVSGSPQVSNTFLHTLCPYLLLHKHTNMLT